jgi:tetratricopeptide (TPR) repeat protein
MKFKLITILVLCLSIQACATIEVNSNGAKRDLLELRDESVIAYNSGKYNKALEGFTYLVKEVPEDAELWFKKANTHARLFQSKEAIESYETALLRDSNHFKAWRNLSVIQLRQAVNSLSQLMAVLPANHPLYNSSLLLANKTMAVLNTKPVLPNATTNKSVEDNRFSSTQSSVEQLLVEKAAAEKAAA